MPQRVASPAQSPGAQAESNGPWSITILISTGSTMIGQVFCGEQFYNAMLQVFQGTGVGDQVDTMVSVCCDIRWLAPSKHHLLSSMAGAATVGDKE